MLKYSNPGRTSDEQAQPEEQVVGGQAEGVGIKALKAGLQPEG